MTHIRIREVASAIGTDGAFAQAFTFEGDRPIVSLRFAPIRIARPAALARLVAWCLG